MNTHPVPIALLLVLISATSLWSQPQIENSKRGSQNIYKADPVKRDPLKVRDYILIIVQERARAGVDADLQADRKTEYSLALDQFIKLSSGNLVPDLGPQPEVEAEAEIKTKGRGKVNRNDRLDTRVQATVMDILPNGAATVEAQTERTIGSEKTIITLYGVAPANAIKMDPKDGTYSITSDRLADLKIVYSGEGPVSGRTRLTWIATIVDWIWPF